MSFLFILLVSLNRYTRFLLGLLYLQVHVHVGEYGVRYGCDVIVEWLFGQAVESVLKTNIFTFVCCYSWCEEEATPLL